MKRNQITAIVLAAAVFALGFVLWQNRQLYSDLDRQNERAAELRQQRSEQHARETERMIREGR